MEILFVLISIIWGINGITSLLKGLFQSWAYSYLPDEQKEIKKRFLAETATDLLCVFPFIYLVRSWIPILSGDFVIGRDMTEELFNTFLYLLLFMDLPGFIGQLLIKKKYHSSLRLEIKREEENDTENSENC